MNQDRVTSLEGVPSEAVRSFLLQVLDKAKTAIPEQSVEERYFRTHLFPICKKDLPEAQAKLKEMHDEFIRNFSCADESEEVYALSFQYFRMTEPS